MLSKRNPLDVSIIIINYNTIELTKKCIQSVKAKTKGVSYEIIIVDNNSKESNTRKLLETIPGVRYIQSKINLGFAKGNNLGIQNAKGNYLLLINSDTELINDAITIAYNNFKNRDEIGVVSAQLQFPDGRIQHTCDRFPSIRYLLFERLRIFKFFPKSIYGKILLGPFFNHQSCIQPDWVWGAFFMFPRYILDELPNNKLADDFFMYCEDIQWGMDIKRLGYKIQFLPEAKVIHFLGGSSGARDELMTKNRKILLTNNYNPIHRKLLLFLEGLLN